MVKVLDLMVKDENAIYSKEDLLRNIGEKYQKRLKEKSDFWNKQVESIKMDFTFIPQHDERLAFWLIRKGNNLVVQCFVFKYQYSTNWQLILNKEIEIKNFESGFDVASSEKEIMNVIDSFLEMDCKDSQKDDDVVIDINTSKALEVEFFNELPNEKDPTLKEGMIYRVNKTRDYSFAGYYIWNANNKKWEFERDLD